MPHAIEANPYHKLHPYHDDKTHQSNGPPQLTLSHDREKLLKIISDFIEKNPHRKLGDLALEKEDSEIDKFYESVVVPQTAHDNKNHMTTEASSSTGLEEWASVEDDFLPSNNDQDVKSAAVPEERLALTKNDVKNVLKLIKMIKLLKNNVWKNHDDKMMSAADSKPMARGVGGTNDELRKALRNSVARPASSADLHAHDNENSLSISTRKSS